MPNKQWMLPLESENKIVLSEGTRAEAIRALADLLLEAAGQLRADETKGGVGDEPQDQA